jgi:mucin-19
VDTGLLSGTAALATRQSGINYYGIESLDILLGSGNDIFSVLGTTAATSIAGNAGNDVFNVSYDPALLTGGSVSNGVNAIDDLNAKQSDPAAPVHGTLQRILGALTIDAGADNNTLNVSAFAEQAAKTSAVITDHQLTGLAPAVINYLATGGSFGHGINIWLGTGNDVLAVQSARLDDVTTVYGNQGDDSITFAATATPKLFVVHADEGSDTIDAHLVTNTNSVFVFVGDMGQEDYSGTVMSANSLRNVRSINGTLGAGDTLIGGAGHAILIGGRGDDILTGGASDDVIIGDNGEAAYTAGATAQSLSTLAVNATAGVYVLTDGQSRAALAWDADAATIQAALAAFTAIGAGHAQVSGSAGNWQLAVQNPDGNRALSVAADALASVNADLVSVAGHAGSYVLSDGVNAVTLRWDADAAAIQTALERFTSIGAGHVTVSAAALATTPRINYQNLATDPSLRMVSSTEMGLANAVLTGGRLLLVRGTAGTVVLSDGVDSVTLAWNASAAEIRTALERFASVGAGNASVTGTPGSWILARQDGAAIAGLSLVDSSDVALSQGSLAERVLSIDNGAGSFVISDGTDIAALAGDADASTIQAALERFANLGAGNVTVSSGSVAGTWQIGLLNGAAAVLRVLPVGSAAVGPVAASSLTVANIPGSYLLSDDNNSVLLNYSDDAATIASALNTFANVAWTAAVTATAAGSFDVRFTGVAPVLTAQSASGVLTRVTSKDMIDQYDGLGVKLGNDRISAGAGNNTVIGGVGADTINALGGNDTVMGDNGRFDFSPLTSLVSSVATTELGLGAGDVIDAGDGENILLGGFGSDRIAAGIGYDVIIGDNGRIDYNATGILVGVQTTDDAAVLADTGDADVILTGGGSSHNIVLAGLGGDQVNALVTDVSSDGADIVLGDNGIVTWDASGTLIAMFASIQLNQGGDDVIRVGAGNNIVVGGFGTDDIAAGVGNNIVLGDNAEVIYNTAGAVTLLRSTDLDGSTGAGDTINVGDGNNTVIAGTGADSINTGNGNDTILGDSGIVEMDAAGVNFSSIRSTLIGLGGNDIITAADGNKIVIGGDGSDQIALAVGSTVPSERIVFGDNGQVDYVAMGLAGAGKVLRYASTDLGPIASLNYDDSINVGDGNNTVIAGLGADSVHTGMGQDTILGDGGIVQMRAGGAVFARIESTLLTLGGEDRIVAGDGDKIVIAGLGADAVSVANGNHIVFGDNGIVVFDANGALDYALTGDPLLGGNDTLVAGDGMTIAFGGAGGDLLSSGGGNDILFGDGGRVIRSSSGNVFSIVSMDVLLGGNDILVGGAGNDILIGGQGDDLTYGTQAEDLIFGGAAAVILSGGKVQSMESDLQDLATHEQYAAFNAVPGAVGTGDDAVALALEQGLPGKVVNVQGAQRMETLRADEPLLDVNVFRKLFRSDTLTQMRTLLHVEDSVSADASTEVEPAAEPQNAPDQIQPDASVPQQTSAVGSVSKIRVGVEKTSRLGAQRQQPLLQGKSSAAVALHDFSTSVMDSLPIGALGLAGMLAAQGRPRSERNPTPASRRRSLLDRDAMAGMGMEELLGLSGKQTLVGAADDESEGPANKRENSSRAVTIEW